MTIAIEATLEILECLVSILNASAKRFLNGSGQAIRGGEILCEEANTILSDARTTNSPQMFQSFGFQ